MLVCFLLGEAAARPTLWPQEAPVPKSVDRKPMQPTYAHRHAEEQTHRFWDFGNAGLFVGVATVRTLDYTSSQRFRVRGINDGLLTNDIVDNKPLFAAIEVAAVGASVGVSYLFHRSGHRKLERWVSIFHISVGVGSSARNYVLKPNGVAVPSQ